jgi:hypothetical protein
MGGLACSNSHDSSRWTFIVWVASDKQQGKIFVTLNNVTLSGVEGGVEREVETLG